MMAQASRLRPYGPAALLFAVALVLPWVAPPRYAAYAQHVAVQMMLLGTCAMAWDLVYGYAGLFSFGHAAFFGAGAYTAAMLSVNAGVQSPVLLLLAASGVAGGLGAIVGFLASRVAQVAVFLVTFAAAETLYLIALSDPGGLTNGDNGLPGVTAAPMLGLVLTDQTTFYYVALAAVVGSYVALSRVTRSRFGQVLVAIRENETRVRFAGYDVEAYKTAAFAISGCFAGLSGALTALHERIAAPESLSWIVSGDAVLYGIVGGTGTLAGPLLGAGLIIGVRELLSDVVTSWLIFVGAAYIVLVFFFPTGLYPYLRRWWGRAGAERI
jgi:branched-chain amino acid transport system permease protein